MSTPTTFVVTLTGLGALVACGGAPPSSSAPQPSPEPTAPNTTSMTEAQCKAAGGEAVFDIGDGAIHQPGYRCARSGQPPVGAIAAEPGEPIAVEGAVCCR